MRYLCASFSGRSSLALGARLGLRYIHNSLPVPGVADQDVHWSIVVILNLRKQSSDVLHACHVNPVGRDPQVLAYLLEVRYEGIDLVLGRGIGQGKMGAA